MEVSVSDGGTDISTHLWRQGLGTLSNLLDSRAVTSTELVQMSLSRLERLDPILNMFVHVDAERALRAAKEATRRQLEDRRLGPLDGIPVAVKDNLFVAGMPASWGSLLFRDHSPPQDDICVERLQAAGSIVIGKTTTPEFALSGRTESRLAGITRNPWDPTLTPGGSSGGSVAAVAAGIVPYAIGTDAGGSIRMPAGYTNLVGLRPSNGRIPRRYGFPPMALDFQAIGPVTRTVRDLELVLDVLAGPDARDPASSRLPPWRTALQRPLRLGWFTAIGDECADAAVTNAIEAAVSQLARLGCTIVPCGAPFDLSLLRGLWSTLTAAGAARVALRFPDRWRAEVTDSIAATIERGLALSATSYVEAMDQLAVFRADVSTKWGEFDALIMPTTPSPAWPVETEHPAEIGGQPGSAATQGMFCGWVNAVGYAGLSIPVAPHPDGRPVGMQIVAQLGNDAVVLEVARRLEADAPWDNRWPDVANAA
jgi:aspartyl-tRNA(Asn)/glutamyl-tRNA(Gln) amidotransferase subunit A